MAQPLSPLITDTPPTPIEEPRSARHRNHSRSRQFLDTITHYKSRSRSSSASGAPSPTNVIANLGLAAGSVGVEHIAPVDKEIIDGVKTFLSSLHSMITRKATGLEGMVEEIKVGCHNHQRTRNKANQDRWMRLTTADRNIASIPS